MNEHKPNNYPKLHNAMWPGLVGKGSPGAEPCLDLDTMLDLTAKAEVNGVKFDGVDIFLFDPHISIDIGDDGLKRVAEKIRGKGFVVGSVVAPVWPPTGGGSAMGGEEERKKFVGQVRKGLPHRAEVARAGRPAPRRGADRFGLRRDRLGKEPEGQHQTNRRHVQGSGQGRPKTTANGWRRKGKFAGAACTVGNTWCNCWRKSASPRPSASRRTWRILFFTRWATTRRNTASCPRNFIGSPDQFHAAMKKMTKALRPWTIDFHVAQNDATVKGSGSHDKTGRHCLATDPNGKLNIARDAGYWMRDEKGKVTKKFKHICWDGCMFPNEVMMKPETWNNILAAMIQVRENHGWRG